MSRLDPKTINWGSSLDAQLERLIEQSFVKRQPSRPVSFPAFDSASLPSAAQWLGANIYVTDKGCNAVSNGSAWVRPDGSAL